VWPAEFVSVTLTGSLGRGDRGRLVPVSRRIVVVRRLQSGDRGRLVPVSRRIVAGFAEDCCLPETWCDQRGLFSS
jgi:hypothetical protein